MDWMVKDKKDSEKSSTEREHNQMLELLRTFYNPEQEIKSQDFSEFFSQIEKKIDKENPSSKIVNSTNELESLYLARQQRLEQFFRRIEEGNFSPLAKLKPKYKQRKLLILTFISISFFTLLYFVKNFEIVKKHEASDFSISTFSE